MKKIEDTKEDNKTSVNSTAPAIAARKPLAAKTAQAKPPQAKSEMSKPEYRKFLVDWQVYKSISGLPSDQITPHLYNACDSDVQAAIINDSDEFLQFSEEKMLTTI